MIFFVALTMAIVCIETLVACVIILAMAIFVATAIEVYGA